MKLQQQLLETAARIGHQLCRDSIWHDGCCNWLGWHTDFQDREPIYSWKSLGPTVYDGTAGIACFLGQLYRQTQDEIHAQTARGAIAHAFRHHEQAGGNVLAGFYAGTLGIGAAGVMLGTSLDDEEIVETGLNLIGLAASSPQANQEIDVIGGSAGAIPILIGCAQRSGRSDFLESAIAHTKLLVQRSQPWGVQSGPASRSWPQLTGSANGLTGYSHGTAGIANALLEANEVYPDESFLQTARAALEYERANFDSAQSNWYDLRELNESDSPTCTTAWCHGSPGIGLARLRTSQLLPNDPIIANDIQAALRSTLPMIEQVEAPGNNFSLCHGLLGNAEFPWMAHQLGFIDDSINTALEHLLAMAVERHGITHLPWRCGTNDGRATPGLMLGLSGIGYALLRFSVPATPSMLLLQPQLMAQ